MDKKDTIDDAVAGGVAMPGQQDTVYAPKEYAETRSEKEARVRGALWRQYNSFSATAIREGDARRYARRRRYG